MHTRYHKKRTILEYSIIQSKLKLKIVFIHHFFTCQNAGFWNYFSSHESIKKQNVLFCEWSVFLKQKEKFIKKIFYADWVGTYLYPNLIVDQNEIPLIFCLRHTYLVTPLVWLLLSLYLIFFSASVKSTSSIYKFLLCTYMKTTMITDDNNKILKVEICMNAYTKYEWLWLCIC